MQAVEILSSMSGVKIPEQAPKQAEIVIKQQNVLQKALEFFQSSLQLSGEAVAYCKRREITKDLIEKFSIGYAPKDGKLLLNALKDAGFATDEIVTSGLFAEKNGKLVCRFRDRIMFPVLNKKGLPIAFGGRSLQKDALPKYINSPETEMFQKRETLYGYDSAIKNISKSVPFVVVEGYMDVIMMNRFGYATAVATMGTAFSSQHLAKLWRYSDSPIICLDGDTAGYNAMVKIALLALPYLQPGKSLKFCRIPGNDDPDSFLKHNGKPEMDRLLATSENLIDFIWNHYLSELNSIENRTPEIIAKWKIEIFEKISGIQNKDIKLLYEHDLKERIWDLLGRNTKLRSIKRSHEKLSFQIDRNEKILLREVTLLYILITYPSIVLAVLEELATIEFSNDGFERLRRHLIEYPYSIGEEDLKETVETIKRMACKFWTHGEIAEAEAERLWRSIYAEGFARARISGDLAGAKGEYEQAGDEATWGRYRALKLECLKHKI